MSRQAHRKQKSWLGWFFHFLISTPVRQIILLVVFVALLFWQWPNIMSAGVRLFQLLGWGLWLLIIALGILLVQILRRKAASLVYHFNRWLGGVAFILAVWGILAFFSGEGVLASVSLGGEIGRTIIDYRAPMFIQVLRVLGLVVVGFALVAPRTCLRLLGSGIVWLGERFKGQPRPSVAAGQEAQAQPKRLMLKPPFVRRPPPLPTEMEKPLVSPEMAAIVETPGQVKDLRQVAQEVWKKYGQSSELTVIDGWRLPPIDILDRTVEVEFSQADNMQRARLIEEALASYGVEVKVVQINAGPTVTQFGVEPGWDRKFKEVKEKDRDGNIKIEQEEVAKTRVKVERITSLANDLALALAASSLRIEAPVPGKSIVGIEVPNTISGVVSLRGVVETSAFQKLLAKSRLTLALGKGAGGEAAAGDLTKMPHLLIAGATGSGKTVCLQSIICCLLLHNTPNDVRFVMIDPKRVELTVYNSIPHLATPVIVDTQKALSSLRWLNQEMDQRYQKLAAAGARNIESYNKNRRGAEKLPYLVLIVDELADLMMTGSDEVEIIICRLAQLARAVGIHLVVATQRPSVDVITGLIKANFPTRISFAVTSQVDSRTILDGGGAEKLLGRGDMLYMPTEAAKPKRLQGCFVSDNEMERLVYFWGSQPKESAESLKITELVSPVSSVGGAYPGDPLLETARKLAQEHEHISTSFLQRRLRIGYPRAARLMEQLEEEAKGGEEKEG